MIIGIDIRSNIIYGNEMKYLHPIVELRHAISNANKKDAKTINRAIKLLNSPDKYMDSKRDCHKIVEQGLKVLEKNGHNSTGH